MCHIYDGQKEILSSIDLFLDYGIPGTVEDLTMKDNIVCDIQLHLTGVVVRKNSLNVNLFIQHLQNLVISCD